MTGLQDGVTFALIHVSGYPWMMIFFGLSLGMAGLVKPTELPLGACLLGLAVRDLKGKGDAIAAYGAASWAHPSQQRYWQHFCSRITLGTLY
jgi:hypothetical protein